MWYSSLERKDDADLDSQLALLGSSARAGFGVRGRRRWVVEGGDAVGEYIDDMGVCRTDDESFAADCPATPAVPTLCSMCATVRKKVCPELVEYEADCTLKRTCWYDKATSKLVGARYCDDSKIHCDNKSMCLNRGSTPLCQGNVDVCIGDAGTD